MFSANQQILFLQQQQQQLAQIAHHQQQSLLSNSQSQSHQPLLRPHNHHTLQHHHHHQQREIEEEELEERDNSHLFKYQQEISAMMYTFGEIRHSLPETTQLMESIIHSQTLHLLIRSAQIARKRNARHLSHEDIIFMIRRDRVKVARLTAYLGWKKVRRIANRTGSSNNASAPVDILLDEFEDVGAGVAGPGGGSSGGVGVESSDKKLKRQKISLFWKATDQFDDLVEMAEFDISNNPNNHFIIDRDEDEDEEEREVFEEGRLRLLMADRLTAAMTKEEYMDYAECRQSSFTYKKPSKFREWLDIENQIGMKPNNDILDILGFLCYEMVRTLTEQSLAVKKEMESRLLYPKQSPIAATSSSTISKSTLEKGTNNINYDINDINNNITTNTTNRPKPSSQSTNEHFVTNSEFLDRTVSDLRNQFKSFSMFASKDQRTPVEPVHLGEAYRRLQLSQQLPSDTCSPSDAVYSVRLNSRDALTLFTGGGLNKRFKRNLI